MHMERIDLYDAIFHRKSIRKYKMKPLSFDILEEIQNFVKKAKPLDDKIEIEYVYLAENSVRNLLPVKAPHYLCLYSEKTGRYLMNAGYLMQQVDLYLSSKGIASCWLGRARPSKEVILSRKGLEFIIMLAFGDSNENIHRQENSEFNRKPLEKIPSLKDIRELLEPVRLAPSSTNSQPWYITGSTEEMILWRERLPASTSIRWRCQSPMNSS